MNPRIWTPEIVRPPMPVVDGALRHVRQREYERWRKVRDPRLRYECLPAFVQAGQCNTGGFSCTITLTLTAGNSVHVSLGSGHTAPTFSVSDGVNTYNTANALHHYGAGSLSAQSFIATNVAGGSTVITCTTSDNTDNLTAIAIEFSGASVLDQVSAADTANTGASGTADTGITGTTTDANEIIIATYHTIVSPSGWTNTSGYTIPANGSQVGAGVGSALEYQIVSATGTFRGQATETVLRNTIGLIATYKAAGGGTRGLFMTPSLSGVGIGGSFFRDPLQGKVN